jgi:Hint domain-containing protein
MAPLVSDGQGRRTWADCAWGLLPKRVKFMVTSCANGYNDLTLPNAGGKRMMSELQDSNAGMQRTRRNIMKMGAIAVPATLATVKSASAGGLCEIFPIPFLCPPPGNNNGGGGNQGHGGNCFLKGTKVLTAKGERKIEDLAIDDLLPTMSGGLRPVQWIGRYPYKKSDPSKPWAQSALPVRISRSALGPNVPHADLHVTASHSLLIDGVLVPAELLINGTTITRYEPEGDEVEFFHVKLESHDVIYAEGAPAETLLNVGESAVNFAEYFRIHGMPTREESPCLPVIPIHGGRVELMSRLRSALSPWIDLRGRADVVRDRLEECRIV